MLHFPVSLINRPESVDLDLCIFFVFPKYPLLWKPGPVAWSDARPTGVRTVTSSIVGPATFFCGDWSWSHLYGHSLFTADSSRAVVSYWRKDVHSLRKPVQQQCAYVNWPSWHDHSCWLGLKTTHTHTHTHTHPWIISEMATAVDVPYVARKCTKLPYIGLV